MSLSEKSPCVALGCGPKHGLIERQMPELRQILYQSAATAGLAALPMVMVAPTEARMMHMMAIHCDNERYSWRKSRPDSAPNAGSMLINVPKVRAGIRVRATISSV